MGGETYKETCIKRKLMGICVRCGKHPVRVGCVSCNICMNHINQLRLKNRNRARTASRELRITRKTAGRYTCCGRIKDVETMHCVICKNFRKKTSAGYRHRLKMLVFNAYGGGGNRHRKTLGGNVAGIKFYNWLKKNDFPPGFQVACMNCQFILAANKDPCLLMKRVSVVSPPVLDQTSIPH